MFVLPFLLQRPTQHYAGLKNASSGFMRKLNRALYNFRKADRAALKTVYEIFIPKPTLGHMSPENEHHREVEAVTAPPPAEKPDPAAFETAEATPTMTLGDDGQGGTGERPEDDLNPWKPVRFWDIFGMIERKPRRTAVGLFLN